MSLSSFSLEGKKALVVGARRNMGKGFAMRSGIQKAKGDFIIFMGGDGQDDPEEIPEMYNLIINKDPVSYTHLTLPTKA